MPRHSTLAVAVAMPYLGPGRPGLDNSQNPGWEPGSGLAAMELERVLILSKESVQTLTRLQCYHQSWVPKSSFLKSRQFCVAV